MTDATAEKLTNLAFGAAVAGGLYYVLRTPSLRRAAWRIAVTGVTRTIPAWLGQEILLAWHESGRSIGERSAAGRLPAVQPAPFDGPVAAPRL
ncbi:MAG: hypothetical protein V7647_3723 [Acidobacteriota bacterium]|jgi:hypothetical protein